MSIQTTKFLVFSLLIISLNIMAKSPSKEAVIASLGMGNYHQGQGDGAFKIIHETKRIVPKSSLGAEFSDQDYKISTTGLFLLAKGGVLKFHGMPQEKIWFHLTGRAMKIYMLHPDGRLETKILGKNIEKGEVLHYGFPSNVLIASTTVEKDSTDDSVDYALISCSVFPNIGTKDRYVPTKEELLTKYPQHSAIIAKLYPSTKQVA